MKMALITSLLILLSAPMQGADERLSISDESHPLFIFNSILCSFEKDASVTKLKIVHLNDGKKFSVEYGRKAAFAAAFEDFCCAFSLAGEYDTYDLSGNHKSSGAISNPGTIINGIRLKSKYVAVISNKFDDKNKKFQPYLIVVEVNKDKVSELNRLAIDQVGALSAWGGELYVSAKSKTQVFKIEDLIKP